MSVPYDYWYNAGVEQAMREMFRARSIRTTRLTVWRIEDAHEYSPTRLDVLGPRRCTVGLREGTKGAVRTITVPCDTIGDYRIGDTYEERIERV